VGKPLLLAVSIWSSMGNGGVCERLKISSSMADLDSDRSFSFG